MSDDQFRHVDTRKRDGLYIQWARILVDDCCNDRPDERDDGFWPSRDPKAAGYVGKGGYGKAYIAAQDRMDAWKRGDWNYIGVQAQARCLLVRNGHGTFYTLTSPGVYGVESDAGDYLDDLFREEKAALAADMKALGREPVEQEDV